MSSKNVLHRIGVRHTYVVVQNGEVNTKIAVQYRNFPDGDTHCAIDDADAVAGKPVLVVHDLYPNQNEQIVRLLLLIDLLKELGATKVAVFVPYLPYARQDRRHIPNEAISIDTVCKSLVSLSCECLYTVDCHFMRGRDETTRCGLRIKNDSASALLVAKAKTHIGEKQFEVIGPDGGAAHLVKEFGSQSMHKQRGMYEEIAEGVTYRQISELKSDHIQLKCDTVVILDDIISTGSTLLKAIDGLKPKGAESVYCVATHGLFLGEAYELLTEKAAGTIYTDTIPREGALAVVDDLLQRKVLPDYFNL